MIPFNLPDLLNTSVLQLIHGLVDRIMEVTGNPFVSPGNTSGYYIESSDVSLPICHELLLILFSCPCHKGLMIINFVGA